jgi:hypothetical protein
MRMSVSKIAQLFGIIFISSSCVDKFSFDPAAVMDNLEASVSPSPASSPVASSSPTPSPSPTNATQVTLRTYKPALAVRGAQCMMCHSSLQANIVTDFGYGSSNYLANPFNLTNIFTVTQQIGATNFHASENAYTNQRDAWQSANAIEGQIIVPRINIADTELELMVGTRQSITMKELMEHPNLTGTGSMVSRVSLPAGVTDKVLEKDEVVISYPTRQEILDLLPVGLRSDALVVYPKSLDSTNPSVANNFVLDSGRSVVRNSFTTPVLECRGDVIVKGTLLLKNVVISTDRNGCRLYVTEGIHIQGTVVLQAPTGQEPNLQLSSAKAILIGFSADSMGSQAAGGRADTYSPISGTLARFATRLDVQYNPSGSAINGIASATFFDELGAEATRLGDYLKDAIESAVANEVPTGASIVGGRLAVNYSGILLNAPHVHSRYYGDIEGAVITDVAFLARNPAGQNLERFVYDSVFDTAPAVLPALGRDMLRIR